MYVRIQLYVKVPNMTFISLAYQPIRSAVMLYVVFFVSSRRRHTSWPRDWNSDVCSSDLARVLSLLCGCGLSGEDLVAERFELYRGENPQRAVEAPVVVPVDPAGGRELDVRERPERPGVEDGGAGALGLDFPTAELRAVPSGRSPSP